MLIALSRSNWLGLQVRLLLVHPVSVPSPKLACGFQMMLPLIWRSTSVFAGLGPWAPEIVFVRGP